MYIHSNDNLKFSPNFLEAIKKIELSKTIFEEDEAARELLDDYGTHYPQEVHMGSALTIEKTFDQTLEAMNSEKDIDKCEDKSWNLSGQKWSDTRECEILWTGMNSEEEVLKEKMNIYSIGCAPQDSTDEWLDNLSTDTSSPAPIEWRNFRPISELLGLKGITDHLVDGGRGLTRVKDAMWRAYDDYCKTYRVEDDQDGKKDENKKKKRKMRTGARCELGCPKEVHFTREDKRLKESLISSIETETVDKEHADTGNKIQIEIKCGDEKCLVTLDNPNKEKFQRGATDTFTGNIIENCNKLTCSTDLKMKLINKGVDGWSPKSTR